MTATHPNSLSAFEGTREQRATLESRIMGLMADGKARTDRMIANELDILESQYRPRINELVSDGRLFEVGSALCQWTGKTVRLTKRFL